MSQDLDDRFRRLLPQLPLGDTGPVEQSAGPTARPARPSAVTEQSGRPDAPSTDAPSPDAPSTDGHEWRLDEHTRQIGLRGVTEARSRLCGNGRAA